MSLSILNFEQVFELEKEQFITKSVLIGRSFDNLRNITIKSSFFSDIKEMNLMVKFAQLILLSFVFSSSLHVADPKQFLCCCCCCCLVLFCLFANIDHYITFITL